MSCVSSRLLKLPLFLAVGLITGCVAALTPPLGAAQMVGAVVAGSVSTIQRTPLDAAYSLVTGRDCSMVRLDQGKTYCRPVEPPPDAPPYCTRSLGVADCWQDPAAVLNVGPDMADGPRELTKPQEENRTRRWP
jgi:hypothetical protein